MDTFFALASIVADEMYGKPIPIVALSLDDFARLRTGDWLTVDQGGVVSVDVLRVASVP